MLNGKKTFIGIAVMLIGAFGLGDIVSPGEFEHVVNLAFELVGSLIAIYGRVQAKVQY